MPKKFVAITVVFVCAWAFSYAQIAAGVMFLRKRVQHITQPGPEGVDKVTKELTTQLGLTPEQQNKVQSILSITRQDLEKILLQGEEAINNILTDGQKVKFEQVRSKIEEKIKSEAKGE
jgi:hypothetical protein